MGVTKDIKEIKDNLFNIIDFMDKNSSMFVKNPNSDFTRNRKMNFKDTVNTIISMGGNSIKSELLELSNYNANTITSSGFCGQRDKILPESFKFLFDEFTDTIKCNKTYKGYRLLACDGSNLNIYRNPNDKTTYIQSGPKDCNSKGHNSLHLNVLYDILNHIYTDIIIQDIKNMNEKNALNIMMDRYNNNDKTIIIADRGYESYNVFAHAMENNLNFLIRVKDMCSKFSISGTFNLPDTEFDTTISIVLSKKQTKKVKTTIHNYKFVSSSSTFDYLDLHENFYYPMSFRIVRFKISDDTYETIITNLNQDEFTANDIKNMPDDALLDMDYFLNEDEFDDDEFGEEGFYLF